MKRLHALAAASTTGVVAAALVVAPVFACKPQGQIIKTVQDLTSSSAAADANDTAHALAVKTGDTLTYTITVSNAETQTDNAGDDQMVNTVLTDNLPDGVELASNPSQRVITENLGTLKAKDKVTKQYQVKVTADKDGTVIQNRACFTGNNKAGNLPQSGCDVAIVKVSVPPAPAPAPTPTPTPTPMPTAPATPAPSTPAPTTPTPAAPTAAALPNTGPGEIVAPVAGVTALGYGANMLRLKRRASRA